ncbi:MAG: nodulation protein NfeD [Gammaproteobacteria bacterium]|nr:MAG: nodulation protein NfeD [Gammaproteobacteria bacterium]
MWRLLRIFISTILVLISGAALLGQAETSTAPKAILLKISGPIGPATSQYVSAGIKQAQKQNARIVILQMDTPGGLDTSMRAIIKSILASKVPVATFVAPRGARAASAGTYILYASHIAAMAPGTNLGAATPVKIGDARDNEGRDRVVVSSKAKEKKLPFKNPLDGGFNKKKKGGGAMEKKIINDATAYIRSLAQMRGRNSKWAVKAVRKAASLSAEEAVKKNVVDLMAGDVAQLLLKIHGRKVKVGKETIVLDTRNLTVEEIKPDWQNRFLSVIANPTLIPILMMLGVFGLFYELMNPGYVLPGVLGGIFLLLGLYASQVLPVNYAGLALILLGLAFMIGEAFMPSFGALGIGGAIAFVIGSIMLIDTDVEGFQVYQPVVIGVAVAGGIAFITLAGFMLQARKRKVVSGSEEMLYSEGKALESFTDRGRVFIHSEEWQARSNAPIAAGQGVRVTAMDGLVLIVEPIQSKE